MRRLADSAYANTDTHAAAHLDADPYGDAFARSYSYCKPAGFYGSLLFIFSTNHPAVI